MRKINRITWGMVAAGLLVGLFSTEGFCEQAGKFRWVTSVYKDEKGVGLRQPEGVACADTYFLVADTGNNRILKFMLSDGVMGKKTVRIKIPEILYPMRMRVNSKDEIYVLDGRQRRIIRMTPDGEFLEYIEPKGIPGAQKFIPRSFDFDTNDNLYLLDVFSARVLILNLEGEYQNHIDFPSDDGFFSDIAVTPRGEVLLLNSVKAIVFSATKEAGTFTPKSESLEEYIRFPVCVTTDPRGQIYLLDRNGSGLVMLGPDGSFLGRQLSMGWKEGRLSYPAQMCMNGRGEVFIADTNNSRVQIFKISQ